MKPRDRRPFVNVKIQWNKKTQTECIALLDTGAEVSLFHRTGTLQHDNTSGKHTWVAVEGLGGTQTWAARVQCRLQIGNGPYSDASVLVSELPDNIIGMDILRGQSIDTSSGTYIFGCSVRAFTVSALKPVVRGNAKWSPVHIPSPAQPVNLKQYRIQSGLKEIGETVQALLQDGVFREAQSPYNAPVYPVKKPDGSYRLTIDYRGLNKVTPPLAAAVPDMITLVEEISNPSGKIHAVVDLANAFFSIPLAADSQDQFAFTWGGRQLAPTVLPQGFKHSPTICHGLVARDLDKFKPSLTCTMYHYIDDIMLSGPNEEIVAFDLKQLMAYLTERGWAVNMEKVQGPAETVTFLGMIWSGPQRIIPQPILDSISQMKSPNTAKEAQQMLGTMGYWRSFVPHLGLILRPIYNVTRKKTEFVWSAEQEEAFRTAKQAIQAHNALGSLQPDQPFFLDATTTEHKMSWGLWQKNEIKGQKKTPIGFWAKQFSSSQRRYSPLEKTLLAAYTALQHVESTTKQQPVTIRTDLPIAGWVRQEGLESRTAVAQKPTLQKWYLSERGGVSSQEPSQVTCQLAGMITFQADNTEQLPSLLKEESPVSTAEPYSSLTDEEKKIAWFTDGSSPDAKWPNLDCCIIPAYTGRSYI